MENVWHPISFLNGKYEVDGFGKIRNAKTKKIKVTPIGKRGYSVFSACVNGKQKVVTVHKCVARAFIPNPNNLPQVNHINGIKTDNRVENLEWCSASENLKHARIAGLHTSDGDKPVMQIKDDVVICKFKSASEASRITGINRSNICNVCNKRVVNGRHIKSAGGFKWEWIM